MHESEKWKWSRSVASDSQWPHGLQPTRLLPPWDFPGKSTGVGCHCLLQSWDTEPLTVGPNAISGEYWSWVELWDIQLVSENYFLWEKSPHIYFLCLFYFLAALGLRCFVQTFSSCSKQRLLPLQRVGFSLWWILCLNSTSFCCSKWPSFCFCLLLWALWFFTGSTVNLLCSIH